MELLKILIYKSIVCWSVEMAWNPLEIMFRKPINDNIFHRIKLNLEKLLFIWLEIYLLECRECLIWIVGLVMVNAALSWCFSHVSTKWRWQGGPAWEQNCVFAKPNISTPLTGGFEEYEILHNRNKCLGDLPRKHLNKLH